MLCSKCGVQLVQFRWIGVGESDEDFYSTGTVWECKNCGRLFIEYYTTFEITETKNIERYVDIRDRVGNDLDDLIRELHNLSKKKDAKQKSND